MTGVFGNPVSGRHFLDILAFVRSEAHMRWVMGLASNSRKKALARVLKPSVVAQAGDLSMRVFADALQASKAPDIYGKFDEMYFRVAVPRLAHNADVLGDQARVFDPFTDRELVDFAVRMPPRLRAGGGFYKRMILRHLPVDITFVDENDAVRYFSESRERIFARTPAIIGRKVQNCHPPASIDTVNRLLEAFRRGERDMAEFWIQMGPRFVHIRYFALRDAQGNYRGTIEVTQDAAPIRALEGERRLLDEAM